MDYYDQIEEWRAVLHVIAERDSHPYRIKKLEEIREFLRKQRSAPQEGESET